MAAVDRKQKSLAYLLWFLGFFGLCGVHRLYTERYVLGLLYLFTFGFCFLGQLIDLLLIPDDVTTFNHERRGRFLTDRGTVHRSLAPAEVRPMGSSRSATPLPSSPAGPERSEESPLSRRTQALLADAQASMQRLNDGL